MKIQDVNNLSSEEFIENFNNIFEKTSSIAISSEKKRPFNNKNSMIEVFINEFDHLKNFQLYLIAKFYLNHLIPNLI